jgi:hypothetical protein
MSKEKLISYQDFTKKPTPFHQFLLTAQVPYLVLHETTFKVLDANEAALDFFKYTASEIKKKYLYSLTPEKEHKKWKSQLELFKGKENSSFTMPMKPNGKNSIASPVNILNISTPKVHILVAHIDSSSHDNESLIRNLKGQNRALAEQVKRMLEVNRKMVNSYENIKKQYEELLTYQSDNVKVERQNTIIEMVEVFHDKVNKPLNRILDDIQKINDSSKKLDSSIIKRLKLIEESVENIMRVVDRIAEVKDIKKMKYIELSNI